MLGRITTWNVKGYGFIRCSDGRDYFVHISNYAEPVGVPTLGMKIEFELGQDPRTGRTQAVNARRASTIVAGANALVGGAA